MQSGAWSKGREALKKRVLQTQKEKETNKEKHTKFVNLCPQLSLHFDNDTSY